MVNMNSKREKCIGKINKSEKIKVKNVPWWLSSWQVKLTLCRFGV